MKNPVVPRLKLENGANAPEIKELCRDVTLHLQVESLSKGPGWALRRKLAAAH